MSPCDFEAHLPESEIAKILGRSVAYAGYEEGDDEAPIAWFETFADIARRVHK